MPEKRHTLPDYCLARLQVNGILMYLAGGISVSVRSTSIVPENPRHIVTRCCFEGLGGKIWPSADTVVAAIRPDQVGLPPVGFR